MAVRERNDIVEAMAATRVSLKVANAREKFSRRAKAFLSKTAVVAVILGLCLAWPSKTAAYSVLSHEAVIDTAWDTNIRPLLLKRFPDATPEQLKEAHGYAYGGAIIQDMGYYPHGSFLFSDLTHYVRDGDFVVALLRDANDLNGYAFALGALSHYAGDNNGHRIGVNRAVPILYPKLMSKYGDVVTYEQGRVQHVKTEFGFDVLEVAKGHFAPDGYHDFIGFGVAIPLLEQSFRETYGLELSDVLSDEEKAFGSYRRDVSQLIPKATRVAWALKKDDIMKSEPGITRSRFLFNISRASFQKNWGSDYHEPTFIEKLLAFLFKLIPKIGPLQYLQLKTPTPETEKMFESSFNATLDRYRQLLTSVGNGQPDVPDDNLDTGAVSGPGEYFLNDQTHAQLLDEWAKRNFAGVSAAARDELLEFFSQPRDAYAKSIRKAKEWKKIDAELEQLKKVQIPVQ